MFSKRTSCQITSKIHSISLRDCVDMRLTLAADSHPDVLQH